MKTRISQSPRFVVLAVLLAACGDTVNKTETIVKEVPQTPSINGVSPLSAFLGRSATVLISGNDTAFIDATTVSFGEGTGVIVESVLVASPTSLVVDIRVGQDATLGARDITVTTGEADLVLSGAFSVQSPLVFNAIGTAAQGGMVFGRLDMRDLTTPFSTNLHAQIQDGQVILFVEEQTPYSIDITISFDATAAAEQTLMVLHDLSAGDDAIESRLRLEVAETNAPNIEFGQSSAATFAGAFQARLYAFEAVANRAYVAHASVPSSYYAPMLSFLPAGEWQGASEGPYSDTEESGAVLVTGPEGGGIYYLSVVEASGGSDYGFEIELTSRLSNDTDTNGNCFTPDNYGTLTSPILLDTLALDQSGDEDWFSFTVGSGAVGKAFHITTTSIFPSFADTEVAVFYGDGEDHPCTAIAPLTLGNSLDQDVDEDFTSAAIPSAGTYRVLVRAGVGLENHFFDAAELYSLSVELVELD